MTHLGKPGSPYIAPHLFESPVVYRVEESKGSYKGQQQLHLGRRPKELKPKEANNLLTEKHTSAATRLGMRNISTLGNRIIPLRHWSDEET